MTARRLRSPASLPLAAAMASALLLCATHAAAGDCDALKPQCECGDTVTTSRQLNADLENCRDLGLRVESGVTLDCRGHSISGRSDREGILMQSVEGARVRNCQVSGFRFGIRVRAGRNNQISDNVVDDNRRGISIGEAAENTQVEGNTIRGSREMGILVNPGTERTQIRDNVFMDNGRRNFDVREAETLFINRNVVGGRSSYALSMRNVTGAMIRSNEFRDGRVQIRGDSDQNEFLDNQIHGREGFDFRGEMDRDGNWFGPDYNEVSGGTILNARRCFRLAGATYNKFSGVVLGDCARRPVDLRNVNGHPSIGNEFDFEVAGGGSVGRACGNTTSCRCGDSARGNVKLTEDLIGCEGTGLKLEAGTTLDCDGHKITGRRSGDGLRVQRNDSIRIRNCHIENFKMGIRIQEANEISVSENVLRGNSTGVRISGPVSGVVIEKNAIVLSRDFGIRVNDAVEDARIVQNMFDTTGRSHVEIARTNDALIDRNHFTGGARTAIRLIDTERTFVRANELEESGAELRGAAEGNRFLDNHLFGEGFRFDGIEERGGPWRFADHNLVEGGSIPKARRCFYFRGASYNVIRDVDLGECAERPFELKSVDGHVPTGNVIE